MRRNKRHQEILDYLSTVTECSISDICDKFSISPNTARSDINELVSAKLVEKYYGGFKLARKNEVGYYQRHGSNLEEKRKIAEYASSFVVDNECIFVDSGTTCALLADYIPASYHLTIITCNFDFINKAKDITNWSILVLGTRFRHSSYSFTDETNWDYFDSLNINKAFLGTTGFTIKSGATNPNTGEATVKAKMTTSVDTAILLTDYAKFGQTSLYTFGMPQQFKKIITCGKVDPSFKDSLSNLGVEFINLQID